ncbi:hypothetical protein BaRGS_00008570 [Batillaria attramentaria]|uniref:Period n=1 Tax=Batillaria attramentaria TaxID=370345 RepID=A0ABD0LLH0_9CAEN
MDHNVDNTVHRSLRQQHSPKIRITPTTQSTDQYVNTTVQGSARQQHSPQISTSTTQSTDQHANNTVHGSSTTTVAYQSFHSVACPILSQPDLIT